MATIQTCSVPGCGNPAAFRTRARPSYCSKCIESIFRDAGLELLVPFGKPDDYYLARCLTCGEVLHYRFKYLLDSKGHPTGENACHVCHWRNWYSRGNLIGAVNCRSETTLEQAEAEAARCNADLVKVVPGATPGQELYITRCRGCGLLSVERHPQNHEKCRPLKAGTAKPLPATPATPSSATATPEKTYPVTPNQRASAREFQPDNHLAFLNDLSWWDFSRNDNAQLFSLTPNSRKPVFSFCSVCACSFEAPVRELVNEDTGRYVGVCPDCARHRNDAWDSLWQEYRSSVIANYPELLSCWDDDESPRTTVVGSHVLRKWRCPKGHHPRQTAISFLEGGCMVCSGQATKARNAELARRTRIPSFVPHELRDQWHPTRNKRFEYGGTHISEKRKVWWRCDHCGHEWEESVRDRTRLHEYGAWDAWHKPYCRCPECGGTLDSLAWHYPSLAAEWSVANPKSAWDIRPNTTTLDFVPQWICSRGHIWSMPLTSRVRGATCPECREAGKSKAELSYYRAARKRWPRAAVKSGVRLHDESFSYPWTVDILVVTTHLLVIEYDGAYWHEGNADTDVRKSRELIAAGYSVVRLREGDLPFLGLESPSYHEFRVLANGADRDVVLAEISSLVGA